MPTHLSSAARDRIHDRIAVLAQDTGGMPVELCLVTFTFEGGKQRNTVEYLLRMTDLHSMVMATLQLHYLPGINPSSRSRTARIFKITVKRFYVSGPYWWTTPGLQANLPDGARFFAAESITHIIWRAPLRWRIRQRLNAIWRT